MAKIMEDRVEQVTTSTRLLWLAVALITISTFLFGFIAFRTLGTWKNGADFGNTFAALGTYFSGLAFAGLIYTIFLQRQELKLQRQELALTREELKGQKEEMKSQNKFLGSQRNEATFFRLAALCKETFQQSGQGYHQLDTYVHELLFDKIISQTRDNLQIPKDKPLSSAVRDFYNSHRKPLEAYIDILFLTCKFLEQSALTMEGLYTGLLLAQLSTNEKILITLFSVSDDRCLYILRILRIAVVLERDREILPKIPSNKMFDYNRDLLEFLKDEGIC